MPAKLYAALIAALKHASDYNRSDASVPVVVLWTDHARQWESLMPRLRADLPILTLGPYDPESRTGPAIWLRCMIARTLPTGWPEHVTPILYLPGIGRQELRAIEECPRELQPLAELQYRGTLWAHKKNGRDWTIAGFLQSRDDIAVEVAPDAATKDALQRSLVKLADEPLAALHADSPLTAAKLTALLNPEPVRSVLLWMNRLPEQQPQLEAPEWEAFRHTCTQQFGFDPVEDGEVSAALLLGGRAGIWQSVWSRFAEAPARYPNLPELLRRARPAATDGLLHQPSSWPQDNADAESALRAALLSLSQMMPAEARLHIHELAKTHNERRSWVWAELGLSPLASVLPALVTLANVTAAPTSGAAPADIANAYISGGWNADAAALDLLAMQSDGEDVAAVKAAVNAVYTGWLEAGAEAFQQAVAIHGLPMQTDNSVAPKPGCCWLFADGLRYDVGQRLAEVLEEAGLSVDRAWQWGAFPGVTSTAKPAVSPIASQLGAGSGFDCVVRDGGSTVTITTLQRVLLDAGFAILAKDDVGDPKGAAWTEYGALDTTGHALGLKLAARIPVEIREIAGRIRTLLEAGWSEVRVVTDHGWLLVPSGLPKAELPEHLTAARKGRCARLKETAATAYQTAPWRWDGAVRMATPPGIRSFIAGNVYDHGGLSPQECITPVLTVRSAAPAGVPAALVSVRWTGMRCRIQAGGGSGAMMVDLRKKPADPASSIVSALKPLDAAGQVSLVVPNDDEEGAAVVVVLLGPDGNVLAQRPTVVGEGN